MAILISAAFFLLIAAALSVGAYLVYGKSGRLAARLGDSGASADGPTITLREETQGKFLVRVLERVGRKVPVSPGDVSLARRNLISAGYRSEAAVTLFYGVKTVFLVLCVGLALLVLKSVTVNTTQSVLLLAAAACVGFFGPNSVLDRLVAARQDRLRASLPDALDLLVVCVEAGLGLDQAIQNVSRELKFTHQEICDELALVTLETLAGKPRIEALKNLSERTGEAEIQKLVAMLIQTDRFGTSIADSLRTHSDFMRIRRRQEAEERAAKIGVKLVFPIFFFILPSMLLVAAGPGLLQVFKYLFPLMKQFQG